MNAIQHTGTPEGEAYPTRIGQQTVTSEPVSGCEPFGWRFDDIRVAMIDAGVLITAKKAGRQVPVSEDLGLRGQSRIITSLYVGVQLVSPG